MTRSFRPASLDMTEPVPRRESTKTKEEMDNPLAYYEAAALDCIKAVLERKNGTGLDEAMVKLRAADLLLRYVLEKRAEGIKEVQG